MTTLKSENSNSGVEKYIIATKFEPTYAREAFPCFDEPAMKANFSLTMYHEETHRGLWNMPVTKRECDCDDCGAKICRTDFMTSPIMGTYQPTFIIHDMDFIESKFLPVFNGSLLGNSFYNLETR